MVASSSSFNTGKACRPILLHRFFHELCGDAWSEEMLVAALELDCTETVVACARLALNRAASSFVHLRRMCQLYTRLFERVSMALLACVLFEDIKTSSLARVELCLTLSGGMQDGGCCQGWRVRCAECRPSTSCAELLEPMKPTPVQIRQAGREQGSDG